MTLFDVSTALLVGPAVTSALYFWIAHHRLTHWLREAPPNPDREEVLPPVTFFRPLKSGVPNLATKLAVLAEAVRPGDQLLIGVERESAEWAAAIALAQARPELDIAVVVCERAVARNPKISKLLQMETLARHAHWILSDSEAVTDAKFLAAFRREWTRCDVLTAGYRFIGIATWPQRLDAAAVLLTLWPGLAILRSRSGVRLTLGACTGFRRSDLEAVGGWGAFRDDLAEDNRLGQALATAGRTILFSAQVVTLESDPLSWCDYWRHQRRVAVTYRVANPAGFAGAWLGQGVTTSLLLALLRPMEIWTWALFGIVFASRWLTARGLAQNLAFRITRLAPTVLLASLVETACWLSSWGTRSVWWGGVRWRISRRGRLRSAERA